jgi:DNA end-binding protein Ku
MAKEKPQKKYHGARAFWSGTISFGLVSIPVNLFPANRSRSTGLRLLDKDGTPLRRRFFCPKDERDVHPEHVLRGYELENGEYVVVTDEELESLEPRKTRDIDLTRFVNKDDVPATLFERGYYLTPAGDSTKAYRLLAEVMEETGRVGIATFVMRGKEYLVAILAEDGIMRAETLRFQNEVRTRLRSCRSANSQITN